MKLTELISQAIDEKEEYGDVEAEEYLVSRKTKLIELIHQFEDIYLEHGDIDVYTFDDDFYVIGSMRVAEIDLNNPKCKNEIWKENYLHKGILPDVRKVLVLE